MACLVVWVEWAVWISNPNPLFTKTFKTQVGNCLSFLFLKSAKMSMNKIIVGIDEAGRGPLAGPVVAAAVILPYSIVGVADSKKLSAKKRELLFVKIMDIAKVGIGIASREEIDDINILQATMRAMQRAYNNLNHQADTVLIDGNKAPKLDCLDVQAIINGDNLVEVISAASIVAKVTRDLIMNKLDHEFPQYLWRKNAGYGTKTHLEAMKKYGITEHHRLSFAPVKVLL